MVVGLLLDAVILGELLRLLAMIVGPFFDVVILSESLRLLVATHFGARRAQVYDWLRCCYVIYKVALGLRMLLSQLAFNCDQD